MGPGLGRGSGALAQPSLPFSPLLLCPLISGSFRTPRLHRPEGNGPGFGGVGAREVCGPYRHEEGRAQSLLRGWCLGIELAVLSDPAIMSKSPPDLEGSATDPRVRGLTGLGVLPVVCSLGD